MRAIEMKPAAKQLAQQYEKQGLNPVRALAKAVGEVLQTVKNDNSHPNHIESLRQDSHQAILAARRNTA